MNSNFSFYSNGVLKGNDEFGVVAVYFGNASYAGIYTGQESEIVTEKAGNGLHWEIVSQDYSSPMEFTLQLCTVDGSPISPEQERALNNFLCHQGEYGWFFIDSPEYADIWIKCVIHNPKIWCVNNRYGIEYTVTTNSAIAYTEEKIYSFSITQNSQTYNLFIYSDEDRPIFPVVEISMLESGDLIVTNTLENNYTVCSEFKNLLLGEVITIDNDYPDIGSSVLSHSIFNDFNLKWITLYNGINHLEFNKKCNVTIRYREYRKMIVF